MNDAVRSHVYAIIAALAVIAIVCLAWFTWHGSYPADAADLGSFSLPWALLAVMLVWVVIRAIAHGRMSWHVVAVFVAAGALAYGQVAIYCGLLACFSPGAARAIGWFLVIGSIAAALAHHFTLQATSGTRRHA